MIHYHATVNIPGYLPETDPDYTFDTPQEAWVDLLDWYEQTCDDAEVKPDETASHALRQQATAGSVYVSTPGHTGDHDLGYALSVTECDWPECAEEDE